MVPTANIAVALLVVDGNTGLLAEAVVVFAFNVGGVVQRLLMPSQTLTWVWWCLRRWWSQL